ncbi:MAG: ribonuclease HIII [bacterium]
MSQPQQTVSLPVDPRYQQRIRDILAEADFAFTDAPHAFYRAKGTGCVAVFYRSGKLVLQGPNAQTLAAVLGLEEPAVPHAQEPVEQYAAALALHPDPKPDAWIGSDEVGKGDFFGPLVAVAVRVERDRVELLAELGVADSKTLGDKRIRAIAVDLRHAVQHKAVIIGPTAYNSLYAKMRNLNDLLAWAHARAIEDVLAVAPAPYAVVDRFAKEHVLRGKLMAAGRELHLDQRPRAEDDPAVASASILARDAFLSRMQALSKEAGFTIPRGAGPPVLAAGRRLVERHGPAALGRFAKLHFKTTKQILGH